MVRRKILLVGSLPPPYTGQAAMFEPVVRAFSPGEIRVINITRYNSRHLNTLCTFLASVWVVLLNMRRLSCIYLTPSRSLTGCVKDLPALILGRWLRIPVVIHLHGYNFRTFYRDSGWLKPLLHYAYGRVTTAIVLHERMREETADFPRMTVKVVANCYPQEPVREPEKAEKIQILYLSAIMHRKGILEFLAASEMILRQHPAVEVVVAGALWTDDTMGLREITNRFNGEMQRLGELFPGRIRYAGLAIGKEKEHLLESATIFVFPSWHPSEAVPISLLEAMRYGNAVVATRHNFLKEILPEGSGILTEPRSPEALATAVSELLNDREMLYKMQENNIQRAKLLYSPERFHKKIREVISVIPDLKPALFTAKTRGRKG